MQQKRTKRQQVHFKRLSPVFFFYYFINSYKFTVNRTKYWACFDLIDLLQNTRVFRGLIWTREGSSMNLTTWERTLALCCILGTKCVTCSYIDKFALFHNQMNVNYNIFFKFPQTVYFYETESARNIDAQLNFQYTGCLIWYLGKKSSLLDKKVEQVFGPLYFTV